MRLPGERVLVAIRDGLIKAVERFIEPACCPIQNGAKECHLQQTSKSSCGFVI